MTHRGLLAVLVLGGLTACRAIVGVEDRGVTQGEDLGGRGGQPPVSSAGSVHEENQSSAGTSASRDQEAAGRGARGGREAELSGGTPESIGGFSGAGAGGGGAGGRSPGSTAGTSGRGVGSGGASVAGGRAGGSNQGNDETGGNGAGGSSLQTGGSGGDSVVVRGGVGGAAEDGDSGGQATGGAPDGDSGGVASGGIGGGADHDTGGFSFSGDAGTAGGGFGGVSHTGFAGRETGGEILGGAGGETSGGSGGETSGGSGGTSGSGGAPECSGDGLDCRDAVPMRCVDGAWQEVGVACALGCTDGECNVCTSGQGHCTEDGTPLYCALGQWASSGPPCELGCTEGICHECADGDLGCVDLDARACVDGFWSVTAHCTNVIPCSRGECRQCVENDHQCNGRELHRCVGGVWALQETCAFLCDEAVGACTGECLPFSLHCDANRNLFTCLSTGYWNSGSQCGNACSETEGCIGDCVPGTHDCLGNQWRTCNDQGAFDSQTCGAVCAEGLGCVECSPNTIQCSGNTMTRCSAAGSWTTPETCPDICHSTLGCVACNPNDTTCIDNDANRCNALGQWTTTDACQGPDEICRNAACVENTPFEVGYGGACDTPSSGGLGMVYAVPFVATVRAYVQELGIIGRDASSTPGFARVALYADNAGVPGSWMTDTGTLDLPVQVGPVAGTSSQGNVIIEAEQTYWLAVQFAARGEDMPAPTACVTGISRTPTGYRIGQAYGVFPQTFPPATALYGDNYQLYMTVQEVTE